MTASAFAPEHASPTIPVWGRLSPGTQNELLALAAERCAPGSTDQGSALAAVLHDVADHFFRQPPSVVHRSATAMSNPSVAEASAAEEMFVASEDQFVAFHAATPKARRAAALEQVAIDTRLEAERYRFIGYVGTTQSGIADHNAAAPGSGSPVSPSRARQLSRQANDAAVVAAEAGQVRNREAVRISSRVRPYVLIDASLEAAKTRLTSAQEDHEIASEALDEIVDRHLDALTLDGTLMDADSTLDQTDAAAKLAALLTSDPDVLTARLSEIRDSMVLAGASPSTIRRHVRKITGQKTPRTAREAMMLEVINEERGKGTINRAEARALRRHFTSRVPAGMLESVATETAHTAHDAQRELADATSEIRRLLGMVSHETPHVWRRREVRIPLLGVVSVPFTKAKHRNDPATAKRLSTEQALRMEYKRLELAGPVRLPRYATQLLNPQRVPTVERVYRSGFLGRWLDDLQDEVAERDYQRSRQQAESTRVRARYDMQYQHSPASLRLY